jgi:hypothetical protein
MLYYHLHLGLPSGLFPSGFPTKILYAFVMSSVYAICSAPPILLDLIALVILGKLNKWDTSHK